MPFENCGPTRSPSPAQGAANLYARAEQSHRLGETGPLVRPQNRAPQSFGRASLGCVPVSTLADRPVGRLQTMLGGRRKSQSPG